MKTLSLCLLAVGSLGAAAAAQQKFEIHPGETNFTSRGSVGTGTGEILQGFHSDQNRGIGDVNCRCLVNGMQMVLQDQNTSTQESYNIVFRSGTDLLGPDPLGTGHLAGSPIGPFLSPLGTGGIAAYLITSTFTTPVVVPCEDFFAVGLELTAAPGWSADGISVHMARGTGGGNNFHASGVEMAWQIIAGVVTHPTLLRTWRFGLMLDNATVLQMGNSDTSAGRFGSGGYFPDTALLGAVSQGLSTRCQHADPTGTAILLVNAFHSFTGFGTATPIGGINNCLYLSLAAGAPIPFGIGSSDGATVPLLLPGLDALAGLVGSSMSFQAAVIHTGGIDLSNAVATIFL